MKIIGVIGLLWGFLCARTAAVDVTRLSNFDSYIAEQPWLTEKGREGTKRLLQMGVALNALLALIAFALAFCCLFLWH